jgi:hypothetical protein
MYGAATQSSARAATSFLGKSLKVEGSVFFLQMDPAGQQE